MILKRQIVLKAIVTERLKDSLIAEVHEAMQEVDEAQKELDMQ